MDGSEPVFVDVISDEDRQYEQITWFYVDRLNYELETGVNTHDYHAGESVKYRFEVPTDGEYSFYSIGSDDTYATLYDSTGHRLGYSDNDGAGNNFKITKTLSAGDEVYLDTKFKSASKTGTMTIMVDAPESIDELVEGENEFFIDGNKDLFSFTASRTGSYEFDMSEGTSFCIYDSNGKYITEPDYDMEDGFTAAYLTAGETVTVVVFFLDDEEADAWASMDIEYLGNQIIRRDTGVSVLAGTSRTARIVIEEDGEWNVWVSGYLNEAAPNRFTATMRDAYGNTIIPLVEDPSDEYAGYLFELGEQSAGAYFDLTLRYTDTSMSGGIIVWISNYGEDDGPYQMELGRNDIFVDAGESGILEFTAPVSAEYTFYSTGIHDTMAILYDADGNQIDFSDDYEGNEDFRITQTLRKRETVYLEVRYYLGNVADDMRVWAEIPNVYLGDNDFEIAVGHTMYTMFTAPKDGTYTFRSTGTADTVGFLCDKWGNDIDENDDGPDKNFLLEYDMEEDEIVLLAIKYYDNLKSGTIIVNVSDGSPAPETGTTYRAVIVANSDYPGTDSDLPACAGDGNLVKNALSVVNNRGYATRITMLSNPSYSSIESTIAGIADAADSDDVTFFFYSGHGFTNETGPYAGAMWLTTDDVLLLSELRDMLLKVPGKVIVMMDSCGSGAAVMNGDGTEIEEFDAEEFNSAVISAFADADPGVTVVDESADGEVIIGAEENTGELRNSKFYVMTAAAKGQLSWTRGDRYSAFTKWMTDGMGGTTSSMPADDDHNDELTLAELYDYVESFAANESFYDYETGKIVYQNTQVYPENSSYVLFTK